MVAQKVKNLPAMQKTQLCMCVCVCVCVRMRMCVSHSIMSDSLQSYKL